LAKRAGGLLRKSPTDGLRPASYFILIFAVLAAGILTVGYSLGMNDIYEVTRKYSVNPV